jgi:hypothetical protein
MSKGKKSRRSKKILTPEEKAIRDEVIARGSMVVLNREQIVTRLLQAAIRLWFHDEEYLSIHIIASSAYKTLSDLLSKSGEPPWLTGIIGYNKLTETYDFLRHSSSDATEETDFVPYRNLLLLAAAVSMFEQRFSYRTPLMSVLMLRFILQLPAGTVKQAEGLMQLAAKYFPKNFNPKEVANLSGVEFLEKALPLFADNR